ncbi:acyl-CoA dehydrogenase [Rhodococcus triatomae]|uniref:Acyl-CoA dehydrogenase n=1 Tax=Rhodococcus triatomae TaxID=300028 RepID=A0A1G8QH09_9NOCA|nr:acyl-CoA dehydrogenase [Rhodococcus triatomae]QNG20671.1 acyl-CoA dehydrogenase [Rhodococcus triatomae]QNG23411.1 acyl-CoA dehydrogenase [Rhodococcus triatomae]SDJ04017.1 Acyl-CoA dehydrogenase [Rhodococcus triatomae]
MPVALDDHHRALADSVSGLARRHAPTEKTREGFDELATGKRPDIWDHLVRQGLHAMHLPEEHGGADGGLLDLAVVAEQLGRALVPGPWLPTVLTGAILTTLGPEGGAEGPVRQMLGRFGEGATGAAVTTGGLVASPDGDGWVVTGTSGPVLGLPGADEVIVRADRDSGMPLWFRLSPDVGDVDVADGIDLTRAIGRLRLDRRVVEPGRLLPTPDPDRLDLVFNTLLAAEAAGVAGWALDAAVEHVRNRVQFGRPVGSFQAVQHKAAMMLVRTELACAAAWDAARAENQAADQRRLAAAQAALTALPSGIDVALECVTLLGGIGFTWEHDAHLYWRRALSIASVAGAEDRWAYRLGEAALAGSRDFSFVDAHALPELRAEVAAVLDEVAELPDDALRSDGWAPARGGARRARLAEAGLVAPHYPAPYGRGAGPEEQAVIADMFAERALEQPTTVIGEWVLPTLLVHGTEEQQKRFVGPTLRSEIVWCQLFSEPGAGSDLAGLTTRARKVDGGWVLAGQKVWNSMAHEADWGVCLARTDPDAPRHEGISYFLVDMRSPGLDVRPLRQATGHAEFNEVFLDDVFVPDACLVSDPGEGWRLAITTLSNERLSMGAQLSHGSALRVRELVESGACAADRDDVLRVLGRSTGREMALAALNLRSVLGRMSGLDVGSEISVQKVFSAIAQREGSRALVSLLGPAGATLDGGHTIDHIGLPAVLFGGGTIEIQLNVLARRVLELPR